MGLFSFLASLVRGSPAPSPPPDQLRQPAHDPSKAPKDVCIGVIKGHTIWSQEGVADASFEGHVEVFAVEEGDGSVMVTAIGGTDAGTGRRRRYCLTRNSVLGGPVSLQIVDTCGVALARLAGDMRPVRLTRPVLLDCDAPIRFPDAKVTQEVTITYTDRNGVNTTDVRLSVLGFDIDPDEPDLSYCYVKAWAHKRLDYRGYDIGKIGLVVDAAGFKHEPVEWARTVVTIKRKRASQGRPAPE